MRPRQRPNRIITPGQEFIHQEFPKLGLYPHDCSPLKFARSIESLLCSRRRVRDRAA